jgi:hypothetical protein
MTIIFTIALIYIIAFYAIPAESGIALANKTAI